MDESPLPDGGTGTLINPAEHLSQSKLAATFSVSFVRQAGVPDTESKVCQDLVKVLGRHCLRLQASGSFFRAEKEQVEHQEK